MGLYADGEASATSQILAAIDARISYDADGYPKLDLPSLYLWLSQQAETVINVDVSAPNRPAARGVLSTIDINPNGNKLKSEVELEPWLEDPEYPTVQRAIVNDGFRAAVAQVKRDLEARGKEIEDDYLRIRDELGQVLQNTYAAFNMGANMPPTEQRLVDTRYYVYTYVNDIGWESAPSPVSEMVEADQKTTVTISIPAAPSGQFITNWRFYRSNVGTQSAAFQFLAEGPIATLTGTDSIPNSGLGEVITTTSWLPPPEKLKGIVSLPNGVIAGYYDNTVCFCEPFVPYAWPVEYQITVESPIVALGSFGQTVAVFHHRGIDYISGADSASMALQKDVSQQTCASMRSVVPVEGGVVFVSPDGLCIAGPEGVRVITQGRILREDWQALGPDTMRCAYSEGTVYVYGASTTSIYAFHLPSGKISTVTTALPYSTFYTDRQRDAIYGANGLNVYRLMQGPGFRTGVWRSKIAVLEKQTGFAWLSIESDFSAPVTVRWYGDGALRHTATVSSRTPVRLPVGRWLEHEIEVESTARWSALTLASSGDELRGV